MPKTSERVFSRNEMRLAVLSLAGAILLTAGGLMLEQSWRRPSLGPQGLAGFVEAAIPGVVDATPLASSAS